MKKFCRGIVLSGLVFGMPITATAEHSFTANIAATSDYVWRGLTQTDSEAAVQGGLDYGYSGIYVGAWVSNTVFGGPDGGGSATGSQSSELDLYLGFSNEVGGFGYDVGVINYRYPNDDILDWVEYYIGGSYSIFSLQYNTSGDVFGTDLDGDYIEAAVDFELKNGIGLGAHIGDYDLDTGPGDDYTDYSVYLSKEGFTFTISGTDIDAGADEETKFFVSWGKDFDLLK